MMQRNIGGNQADATYRYKMPTMSLKVEGRGNGIKTIVSNIADIAKALRVPASFPMKFFGIEAGALSSYDEDNDRGIVNGVHSEATLASFLDRFIQLLILCPKCHLPELTHSIKKTVNIHCVACGHDGAVSETHKIITFVLKSGKADQLKSLAPAAAHTASQSGCRNNTKLTMHTQTKNKSSETSASTPEDQFREFMKGDLPHRNIASVDAFLRSIQYQFNLSHKQRISLLFNNIFELSHNVVSMKEAISTHKDLLVLAARDQMENVTILAVLCDYVFLHLQSQPASYIPILCLELYDCDVVSETTIRNWAKALPPGTDSDVVRIKIAPLLRWLDTAEEATE